jgi:TolA-binding protein
VAAQQDALLDSAEASESTRRALAERAAKRARRRRNRWRRFAPALVAALAGAAAVAFVAAGAVLDDEHLTFTVGDTARPGVLGAWEHAPRDGVLPIRFSDGTAVRLQPDARARVVRVRPRGADVVIESGRALVEVVPREDAAWQVQSGPFVVDVKGTRFEVGWSPRQGELALRLFEGKVAVTGCGLREARTVKAGEELVAACRRGETTVKAAAPHADSPGAQQGIPAAPAAEPSEPAASREKHEATASSPARRAAPPPLPGSSRQPTWRGLARDGHYRRAYELAVEAGFETECERASAEDALLLADAARLNGRAGHARHAYASVRRRFPASSAAARAAFALGRSAFHAGDAAAAIRWFEVYLAEQPGGALASAAFERLLEASLQLGDRARARAIAAKYLEKYPAGPHAREAHRILGRAQPAEER